MKILQINTTLNSGSTGKIAEGIGLKIIENQGESYIAYGRFANKSASQAIKIGSQWDQAFHLLNTRIFDTHAFHSNTATRKLIKEITKIQPDIVHLHNLHGYYLNVEILFRFLKKLDKPIVWTLHDCWPFTGHCCHFERVHCEKWKTECNKCPLKFLYPQSYLFDNSKDNFRRKKEVFAQAEQLHIVTVSNWLKTQVEASYLKYKTLRTIYNGVNTDIFKPLDAAALKKTYGYHEKQIILGVANVWSEGKGLTSFVELSRRLNNEQLIVLIGITKKQAKHLPKNIIIVERTNSQKELAEYYSMADVFVNPSIAETFGLVSTEAMACGTPSVVYDSTANPELITLDVGSIVKSNDYQNLHHKIDSILLKGKAAYEQPCVQRASALFQIDQQYDKYISLYKEILSSPHKTADPTVIQKFQAIK